MPFVSGRARRLDPCSTMVRKGSGLSPEEGSRKAAASGGFFFGYGRFRGTARALLGAFWGRFRARFHDRLLDRRRRLALELGDHVRVVLRERRDVVAEELRDLDQREVRV